MGCLLRLVFTHLSKFGDFNDGKTHSSVQNYKMFGEIKHDYLKNCSLYFN